MKATITRNFRDVHTTSPKVLLINITNDDGTDFRDHCWVTITDSIKPFIPRTNRTKSNISFTAKTKDYQTRGPAKQTLQSIRNIQRT